MIYVSKIIDINGDPARFIDYFLIDKVEITDSDTNKVTVFKNTHNFQSDIYFNVIDYFGVAPLGFNVIGVLNKKDYEAIIQIKDSDLKLLEILESRDISLCKFLNKPINIYHAYDKSLAIFIGSNGISTISDILSDPLNYEIDRERNLIYIYVYCKDFHMRLEYEILDRKKFDTLVSKLVLLR